MVYKAKRLATEIRTASLSTVATTITPALALLRTLCSALGPHNSHVHRPVQPNSQPCINVAYLFPASLPLPEGKCLPFPSAYRHGPESVSCLYLGTGSSF